MIETRTLCLLFCLFSVVLILPTHVYAKTVPCVVENARGKYELSKVKKCTQYEKDEAKAIGLKLLSVSKLTLDIGKLKLQIDAKDRIIHEWSKVRLPSWLQREKYLEKQLEYANLQALKWQKLAEKYQEMTYKSPWWKHPALWAAVGIVIGAGFTYGMFELSIRRFGSSTSKLITDRQAMSTLSF